MLIDNWQKQSQFLLNKTSLKYDSRRAKININSQGCIRKYSRKDHELDNKTKQKSQETESDSLVSEVGVRGQSGW